MTDNDLKKLNRTELLELLVEQSKKIDQLQAQLDEANRKLSDRQIEIDKAGSIAEASLRLSGEQEKVCARMEEESKKKARALLLKTEERCLAREREADAYWDNISDKLQKFYDDHEGLYQLLQHSMRKPEENKSE